MGTDGLLEWNCISNKWLETLKISCGFIGLNMTSVTHTLVSMQAYSSSIDYQHFAALEKNCLTSTQ